MIYAVYKRMSLEDVYSYKDLTLMNDFKLQKMVMDYLMKEVKIDEDELIDLDISELLELYEETLRDIIENDSTAFDRVLIKDANNKVIVDV